jgi:hypothetical protein
LQVETTVSGTTSVPIIRVMMWPDIPSIPSIYLPGQIYRGNARGIQSHHNPDDGDRGSSRNIGFYLQPIDVAVCLKRFYCI